MMNAVELDNVTKRFGPQVAVDRVSLVVPRGSVFGFIGPNGSGKTTTLRMILRIHKPDSGEIRVLGDARSPAADDRLAYLPEERGLYKSMRVHEVISFYAALKNHRTTRAEIGQWLARLGLADAINKKVGALSKGMSQKVQFICTVLHRPELALLDEPFSGLDPVNAAVLRDLVLELRQQGTTVIFSTHDMAVAERLCDRIFMIYRGRKVLDGTLDEIQRQHADDSILVRVNGMSDDELRGLPGIRALHDHGREKELLLDHGADAQHILRMLCERGAVERFERWRPSLHDIFVRIASPPDESMETGAA